MNPERLIFECRQSGISIRVDGDKIKLRGDSQAVRAAASRLRPYKAELIKHLAAIAANDAEICGLYTPYCCPVSPDLVHELHELIARYAQLYSLSVEATGRIIDAAKRQPLATIPASVKFFSAAVDENRDHQSDAGLPDER